ncbi:MAG: outer membrane protein assembly factor BamD [Bacteroidota bacterium]|nr:outer membrane protein assembly factor BamD [Bacteroidota bacterium]
MRKLMKVFCLTPIILLVALLSCNSSNVEKSLSAEERFQVGMKEFNDKNYLEAIGEFNIVTLQYPGSEVADDAQYYLGECRFDREEYLLAAYEYEALKRNMPASLLVPKAQYKIALSYYKLAPVASLDQSYTLKAIDEFQAFIEYYPTDELVSDAEIKIQELRDRLAQKEYMTAILYMKMEYFKAATFYFNNVLENYHDSKYAESAYVGKIESLIKRKKHTEAAAEAEKFFRKFPNTVYRSEVESILK